MFNYSILLSDDFSSNYSTLGKPSQSKIVSVDIMLNLDISYIKLENWSTFAGMKTLNIFSSEITCIALIMFHNSASDDAIIRFSTNAPAVSPLELVLIILVA